MITKEYFENIRQRWRRSDTLILIIVFIAIFLDNMLMTVIVPIMPSYVYQLWREDNSTHPSEQEVGRENLLLGVLFASKPAAQLIFNPFVGLLTDRIGYSIPMLTGFIIMIVSTSCYAFAKSIPLLFCARAVQGIGSSLSRVAGFGRLADRYTDDTERGRAMGIALTGLGLGVMLGPPFGGIMYQFVGKSAPFFILAALGIVGGSLQLTVIEAHDRSKSKPRTPLTKLLTDPYVMITAGAIMIGNIGIGVLESSYPLWLMTTMSLPTWLQGAAFLPTTISYTITTNVFGSAASKLGRWKCCMVALVLGGVCLAALPQECKFSGVILPTVGLGISIGLVDCSMFPLMGHLADIRYTSIYGSIYAIADAAICLSFFLGPATSGFLVYSVGFPNMLYIVAAVTVLYSPLLLLLRNPPALNESQRLLDPNSLHDGGQDQ